MSQYRYGSIHTGKHWKVGQSLAQNYESGREHCDRISDIYGYNELTHSSFIWFDTEMFCSDDSCDCAY